YAYGDSQQSHNVPFRSPYAPERYAADTHPVPLQVHGSARLAQQTFSYDFLGNVSSSTDNENRNYDRSLGLVTHGAASDGPNQLRSADGIEANYDAAGTLVELKVSRQGNCPSASTSKCAQWFAYDWDEIGQLARARRWDFDATLPELGPGELPTEAPA